MAAIAASVAEKLADHAARIENVEHETGYLRGRLDAILTTTVLTLIAAVGGLLKLLHG
jgi:hypothetical protein